MNVKKTFRDISSLKIQGAEAVAKASIVALKDFVLANRSVQKNKFLREFSAAKKLLVSARPTEPQLRNALKHAVTNAEGSDTRALKENLLSGLQATLSRMKEIKTQLAEIGSRKVPSNSVIFTHCHSSSVVSVLQQAKKSRKKFVINNTEARPRYQGRIMARDMNKLGVKVNHYVDSAVRLALKKADVAFFGCDAITPTRIINKIGSELFAEVAERYDVPLYIVTSSWKFDPETIFGFSEPIEERNYQEIWPGKTKNVKIHNPAFEAIEPKLVTGIISELGVFKHQNFIEENEHENAWMFS